MLGVKWAPLNTPLQRRLQTLAVVVWFVTFVFGGFIAWAALALAALYTRFWWLVLAYLAYMYLDRHTSEQGGRRSKLVRGSVAWRFFCDYFPITLVKTAELDAKRNYLLCVYPHGIISTGAFGAFGTEGAGVGDAFPGMEAVLVTLPQHFSAPFVRDLALGVGAVSSSPKSIAHVLRHPDGGRMAVLMVGGAAESLLARPNKYHIILRRRQGFCRIALQAGTPLVPVFSFGENNLYDQVDNPRGSRLHRFQEQLRRRIGLAPVLPIGRGLFQYSFGLAPRRLPIAVVVGAPIDVERVAEPTAEQIADLNRRFEEALVKLFEAHKETYHPGQDIQLTIE